MAQFAVIGLGRFGAAASLELVKMGHSVLGVDADPKLVDKYADRLTRAVIADVSDSAAVAELALENFDVVLVAIGEDMQASLLCVVHLTTLGIQNIWVKASSHAQHLILNRLGVARVIHPEEEMGVRVAQALSYPMVNDYIPIGNGEFVVEIRVSERLDGAPLSRVISDSPAQPQVLLVKHRSQVTVHPAPEHVVYAKDILVLFGDLDALRALAPRLI
ncbi:potassium channel family protein [Yanghanlia caeni]|uniref:TrkA family potassium uptake protein n=1 Tax=Yanghanlia caeni TaxID=3064283 RepID=A0ABU1D4U1_9BURK|nr:TrkA family potassium uptake protein [Alcaligenaceae bacterium LG-2]